MTTQRWQSQWTLFHELTPLSSADREDRLRAIAQDDADLARELKILLDAHDQPSAIDTPIQSMADAKSGGMRLGPWELLEEIAEGGMGQVWRARRADGRFETDVAVKFPMTAGGPWLSERFASERKILANLSHPNIARLLDGGETDAGQPYLVMEWIDGQPITRFCQQKRMSVARRIELLLPICHAVHYAHRNLIIHRDIKPANILVTDEGVPKLLDFGIAKPLSGLAQTVDQTQTGFAFTPEYAAPEQIRGEPIGTAADVHALGAILFELLTEEKAFQVTGKTMAQWIEEAATRTSPIPSDHITNDPARKKLVSGDLDVIAAKAMHLDPDRRYESAASFAKDLENWLAHRPVMARPDSARYRMTKFVARHQISTLMTALAISALVSLTVILAGQARRLEIALEQATAQSDRATRVSQFLGELFGQASPNLHGGNPPALDTLLLQGVQQIDRASLPDDVRGSLEQTMGRALVDLGRIDEASAVLQSALGRLQESQWLERADTLSAIASVEAYGERYPTAIDLQQQAVALLENHGDALQVRAAKANLAGFMQRSGDRATAREMLEQALQDEGAQGDRAARLQLADARIRMGALLWSDGDFVAAQSEYEKAHATFVELLGPSNPRSINARYAIGTVFLRQGEYAKAEKELLATLEERINLFGEDHPVVATTHKALGANYYQSGNAPLAKEHHQLALQIEESLFGANSIPIHGSLNNLALVEHELGQFDQARLLFERALTLLEGQHGRLSENLMTPLINLALVAVDQERPDLARIYLDRVASIQRENETPPDHPSFGFHHHLLGRALLDAGDISGATAELSKAVELRREVSGGHHPHLADSLAWLARARMRLPGNPTEETLKLVQEALNISREKRGNEDYRTLEIQYIAGQLQRCRDATASEQTETALQGLIDVRGESDWRLRRLRELSPPCA